ncbi:hypothetical protein BD413DRAFT_607417 [Trametes elegans]|nr:hypothetical protein BD413DRAFT_607417 [Trametes elegans]
MFSSFGALRALFLGAAFCSPVYALPRPAALPVKRSLQDYVDHLIYLDANKSSLYAAVEVSQKTYGAYLDNHWDGLVIQSDSTAGSTEQITVDSTTVTVTSTHGSVGFLQEDIELGYYTTTEWPQSWHAVGSSAGIGSARIGIDVTNSKSVMNQYLAGKWSNILDNWYYDLFLFYDWDNATVGSAEIEFAGILTTGSTLDWTSVFDISASDASSYGLPDLNSIKDQPNIYVHSDGTFDIDASFSANGEQVTVSSQVPQTASGSVVVDIDLTKRWSKFPDDVVKGLYGSLPGAKYYPQSTYGYYQFSCDARVSFTFTIGGVKYAVNEDALVAPNPWGDQCIGSVFTKGQAVVAVPQWDAIFGFQFLSSFYFRAGISHSSNRPYYKLLPLPEPNGGSFGSGLPSWSGAGDASIAYSESATAGSAYTYGADKQAGNQQHAPSTSTTFTTVTSTFIGTTTVAWPTSSPGSYDSGKGASGGTDHDANLIAAGNIAETDDDGNDLNLPHGSLAQQLKHCLPAIIVVLCIIALGLLIGVVVALVRRRRSSGGKVAPSAYSNVHFSETHEPVHVPLYGAEEGQSRYADPYKDEK